MKKIIMLAIFCASICAMAQNNYKGKIVNENNEPLVGVTIQSKKNTYNSVVTDINGNFLITLKENTPIIVRFLGFKTLEVTLSETKKNSIQLVENDEFLEEIVISASREKQKRKEVPASISIVSSKDITETKAL